jgi:hypothetical protein
MRQPRNMRCVRSRNFWMDSGPFDGCLERPAQYFSDMAEHLLSFTWALSTETSLNRCCDPFLSLLERWGPGHAIVCCKFKETFKQISLCRDSYYFNFRLMAHSAAKGRWNGPMWQVEAECDALFRTALGNGKFTPLKLVFSSVVVQ